jgi:hypothetical protein
MSHRLARSLPDLDGASVSDVTVTRREDTNARALCIAQDAKDETCVARPVIDESPQAATVQAVVDGHWVIFGYREILPEEASLTAADLRFTASGGTCCHVDVIKVHHAFWYVVRVDDDVDVINTNVGNVFGGIVGSIARPIVASAL